MLEASWEDGEVLDQFFIMGRSLWPDLKDLKKHLKIDRSRVPDQVVRFIRSTCLNEYGIAHYVKQYHRSYGDDYKLAIWATLWGYEEYLHHVVLRLCLKALGDDITAHEFAGLEQGNFGGSYDAYLARVRVSPILDQRLQQVIFNVIQEYAAYVAYTSVSEVVDDPQLVDILRRMARDEMRHCSFFQLTLQELAKHVPAEQAELIWPQFRAFWNQLYMPQDHIDLFKEHDYATDLYIEFWTPQWRSKMTLDLTHFFKKFRVAAPALAG